MCKSRTLSDAERQEIFDLLVKWYGLETVLAESITAYIKKYGVKRFVKLLRANLSPEQRQELTEAFLEAEKKDNV